MNSSSFSNIQKLEVKMVLVVGSDNKVSYEHYTKDLCKNYYVIEGEELGKHLFNTLKIRSKDVESHKDVIPYNTVYPKKPTSGFIKSEIDYYIHPKSALGAVVDSLTSEIEDAKKESLSHSREVGKLIAEKNNLKKLHEIEFQSKIEACERILENKLANSDMRLAEEKNYVETLKAQIETEKKTKFVGVSYAVFNMVCLLAMAMFVWAVTK